MNGEDFLLNALNKRREQHALRELRLPGRMADFCSNDYLGLARSEAFSLPGGNGGDTLQPPEESAPRQRALKAAGSEAPLIHGSGGSRLLAGNYALIEEAEQQIARFHAAAAGLIYNSGYDANLGLFSCVPQKGDTIVYDQLIHASIRDGIRLSSAQAFSFRHNDAEDLQKKLSHATGRVFVAVESVYSMDGDKAPLEAVSELCGRHGALLVVDEAHATGVVGEKGEGLVQQLQLAGKCFARIHTFGKAVGCHGAIILGSAALRDYLINFSRPFIYTTALPPQSVAAILASYQVFPAMHKEREHLRQLISLFRAGIAPQRRLDSETPIQVIMTPGNEEARQMAARLQSAGLDVRPILHPTVPKGQERLRVVLHSFNSTKEVELLLQTVNI